MNGTPKKKASYHIENQGEINSIIPIFPALIRGREQEERKVFTPPPSPLGGGGLGRGGSMIHDFF